VRLRHVECGKIALEVLLVESTDTAAAVEVEAPDFSARTPYLGSNHHQLSPASSDILPGILVDYCDRTISCTYASQPPVIFRKDCGKRIAE
jgi:hypothetical protein